VSKVSRALRVGGLGQHLAVPVRKVINGAPVSSINSATLRNPECLAEYVRLGEEMRKEEGA